MTASSDTLKAKIDAKRLKWRILAALGAWTCLTAGLLAWSWWNIDSEMFELARQEAHANFNKDLAFRVWATGHGGAYVPVSERTQPSPYLAHIPERDLITPSGRRLTLMNPAYMLREMMEDFAELYGVKGKITSLQPFNPDNAPDAWEREALQAFQEGAEEVFEVTQIEGSPFLRLMRPMITAEGCLKCHAHQGYRVGDVRGGVGVSVPLQRYYNVAQGRKQNLSAIMATIWLLGLLVIMLWSRRSRQRIAERLDYEGRIWRQANFDALTELSNRNLFLDRLTQALGHAQREQHQLALLFIDLDHFKDINDTRGHDVGDRLLQEAARRLQASVRESDTVSRLGGDEFTVILDDMAEGMSANLVARGILKVLAQPFSIDGHDAHVSASIGITLFPHDGDTPAQLLKNADTAMYQAKNAGRNAFRYFTQEMNQQAQQRVSLENALRRALQQQEFFLYYQPIVDVRTRRLLSAEALIRWQDPEHGCVMPDQFIAVAESSGLIVPMGRWVLRQAARDMLAWDKLGLSLPRLSVNVSTLQFLSPGFQDSLEQLLRETPQLRNRLCLEITESLFLEGDETLTAQMNDLHQAGVHLAIDDFGTGYSSLGYLKRFPVDVIKIDRSFVNDVITDPSDAALCEAIVAMAHRLGLQVVAEGVETEQQLAFLEASACDKAQGYYFSRPVSFEAFSDILKTDLEVRKQAS